MTSTSKSSRMRYSTWEKLFKPHKNHLDPHAALNGFGFETFGPEQDFAWTLHQAEPGRVWTVVEGESGKWYIVNGWHRVNRMMHLVTEVACDRPFLEIPCG